MASTREPVPKNTKTYKTRKSKVSKADSLISRGGAASDPLAKSPSAEALKQRQAKISTKRRTVEVPTARPKRWWQPLMAIVKGKPRNESDVASAEPEAKIERGPVTNTDN